MLCLVGANLDRINGAENRVCKKKKRPSLDNI